MARDVALAMYDESDVQAELVVPPDVETFERRRRTRKPRRAVKRWRSAVAAR